MSTQLAHLELTVIILDGREKDAEQKVKVLPQVTVESLLTNAVETFSDQLPLTNSAYVMVDKRKPRVPLAETATVGEISNEGTTHLVIKHRQDIPRKIPCLILASRSGPKAYPLREGITTIGRALPDLTVNIDWDHTVSRNSAEIVNKQGELFITRTKAKRFKLNDQPCPEGIPMLLSPEDKIVIGETQFILGEAYEDTF